MISGRLVRMRASRYAVSYIDFRMYATTILATIATNGGSSPDDWSLAGAELVQLPVDVILTSGTPATQGAKQATNKVAIVFAMDDPVAGASLRIWRTQAGMQLVWRTQAGMQLVLSI